MYIAYECLLLFISPCCSECFYEFLYVVLTSRRLMSFAMNLMIVPGMFFVAAF